MTLSDVEQAVLDALDGEALVATLADLVAIESLSGRETPAQEHVADVLSELGIDVDVFPIDLEALSSHPAFSMEFARDDALGVVGSLGGGEGRTLLLDAHVDVVPAGDAADWTHPPWRASVDGGRVFGRGTCDTKGGLACALHAVKAIVDAGVELPGRVLLASVIAEEDGGAGTLAALERGVRADGAVIVEPTDLAIAPAQAGALSFRLTVRGLSAHGALREEGVSAIEKFRPLHDALLELEQRRNRAAAQPAFAHLAQPFGICIGRLQAGDWASSEPDWLRAEGRYGVAPGEDLDAARTELEQAVAAAAAADPWLADHPPTVAWWGAQWLPAQTPPDHPIVGVVAGALADAGGVTPAVHGVPYGSDMGLTVGVGGIPSVVFGPGDVRVAHRPDEHVRAGDLLTAARTLAVTAVRFCGA